MEQLKLNSINHMIVYSIGKLSDDMIDMTNMPYCTRDIELVYFHIINTSNWNRRL